MYVFRQEQFETCDHPELQRLICSLISWGSLNNVAERSNMVNGMGLLAISSKLFVSYPRLFVFRNLSFCPHFNLLIFLAFFLEVAQLLTFVYCVWKVQVSKHDGQFPQCQCYLHWLGASQKQTRYPSLWKHSQLYFCYHFQCCWALQISHHFRFHVIFHNTFTYKTILFHLIRQ